MPQSDPRIDARLKAFLDEKEHEKAEGYTAANILLEVKQLALTVDEIVTEQRVQRQRSDRHGRNIAAIKQHIDMSPDSALDSGLHVVEDLKKELARKNEESLWWKRSVVKWIVAGVAWVATTIAASFISSAWTHKP